jgi:hypothetical protein
MSDYREQDFKIWVVSIAKLDFQPACGPRTIRKLLLNLGCLTALGVPMY